MLFRKFKILQIIKNISIVSALFLVVYFADAQEVMTIDKVAESITGDDLKKHLTIIAHDTLEGRETGYKGQKKAAYYLHSQFENSGLKPVNIKGEKTHFQSFNLLKETWGDVYLMVNGKKYEEMVNLLFFRNAPKSIDADIEVIFSGYGNEEDYLKLDCKNKGVVMLFPAKNEGWKSKIDMASAAGAEYIFMIQEDSIELKRSMQFYQQYFRHSSLNIGSVKPNMEKNLFYITPDLAENIFATSILNLKSIAKKSLKGKYRSFNKIPAVKLHLKATSIQEEIITENVAGFVEGLERPEEVVVVSAHYDHVGMHANDIYNGADDNGSGTSAILELADAFSLANKMGLGPKRTVLFILFTGEEKGLLGSTYYVENPLFPLENTIADFNLDMVGRIDENHRDNPDYVYLIGANKISEELHNISEKANEDYIGLALDYTFNAEDDPNRYYYRSDHYNFAKNGIPSIFYFTGVHEDYHRPTDVVDKILFDRMSRITKLVFYTVWEVANMERKLLTK